MRSVCINTVLYSIFIKGRENAKGMNVVNLNDPNIYVRDVVAMFKLFYWGLPPSEIFFILLPYRYAGAAQPYTRLCITLVERVVASSNEYPL